MTRKYCYVGALVLTVVSSFSLEEHSPFLSLAVAIAANNQGQPPVAPVWPGLIGQENERQPQERRWQRIIEEHPVCVEIQARFSLLLRAHEALCRLDNVAGAACQKLFQRAYAGQEELRSECHGRR